MKKAINSKNVPAKKKSTKTGDSDELRKPAKLKPLKEKEKKSWKNNLDDDDDFEMEDDVKFDTFDDDDDDTATDFFDDEF